MQPEKWINWKPIESIPDTLYLEELRDDKDGLTMVMTREDKLLPSLIINFRQNYILLTNMDERTLECRKKQ